MTYRQRHDLGTARWPQQLIACLVCNEKRGRYRGRGCCLTCSLAMTPEAYAARPPLKPLRTRRRPVVRPQWPGSRELLGTLEALVFDHGGTHVVQLLAARGYRVTRDDVRHWFEHGTPEWVDSVLTDAEVAA